MNINILELFFLLKKVLILLKFSNYTSTSHVGLAKIINPIPQMSNQKKPRYVRSLLNLPKGKVPVYAGKQVSEAIRHIEDLTVYEGVRLFQLLQAVYEQGKKDGARDVFLQVDALKGQIPHRNPGTPKKRKKP